LLAASSGVAVGTAAYAWRSRREPVSPENVFIAAGQSYSGDLQRPIRDGLLATGFIPQSIQDKRVLLKPNLVEPTRDAPQMTTHPAVVVAVADVFRSWGAHVTVGEGPGHVRDTELALYEARLGPALTDAQLAFANLNYEEFRAAPNLGKISPLKELYFPRSIHEADLIVSLPKMKTHHWIGMTGALKNLYGVMPGIRYGWPKNVLHHAGIPESAFDINASLPQTVAIVDGIDCMEGDGPIMGSLKHLGLLIVGTNSTAVDATCARLMGLEPNRIPLLQLAGERLGPIAEDQIVQRGEAWQPLLSPFEILDAPHLREMQANGVLTTYLPPRTSQSYATYPCGRPRALEPSDHWHA
jgi:uncharacterized protein (DUF362 family)